MPNWCDTTYKAVGTKEQVKRFYDLAMRSWKDTGTKKHPKDGGWLGSFVEYLGGDINNVYARGWIQDEPELYESNDEDYARCTIYCNTAWGELSEWRAFIEREIDGLFIIYTAVEPGCGVFLTNDDAVADKYNVDSPSYDGGLSTEDDVIDFVNRHYDQSFKTIEECINFQKEVEDTDDFLYINEMELTD